MVNNPDVNLAKRFSQAPIVEVLGVVNPAGVAVVGATVGHAIGDLWDVTINFANWKYVGGELQNRELKVIKLINTEGLGLVMGRVEPYDVIRIRARVADPNTSDNAQALLVEIIGQDATDESLNQFSLKLQEPVTFYNLRFGTFTLNRRIDWYEAETHWGPTTVRLSILAENPQAMEQGLKTAYSIWDSQAYWNSEMLNYATLELLRLKNEKWLGDNEEELSAEEFKSKLQLEDICIRDKGKFEFWYGDGDLFSGHLIKISGNLSNGPTDAGLEG